jgi:hypothetical protein
MSRDIFDFWSEIPDTAYEHPDDREVLRRMDHGFHPKCLPAAYSGPLRDAPVVLLFLSPGLDESAEAGDVEHSASKKGRRYYASQRNGRGKLPSKDEHPSAYKWLRRVLRQFGIETDADYEHARAKVATMNIGAYKSKDFKDCGMLAALPSSRVGLDWAQSVLFPEAESGKRVVVCLRSPQYWGLGGRTKGTLFCPKFNRGGIMLHAGTMRRRVKDAVQRALHLGNS